MLPTIVEKCETDNRLRTKYNFVPRKCGNSDCFILAHKTELLLTRIRTNGSVFRAKNEFVANKCDQEQRSMNKLVVVLEILKTATPFQKRGCSC